MTAAQLTMQARLQAQAVESAIVRGDTLAAAAAWALLGDDIAALHALHHPPTPDTGDAFADVLGL